MSFIRCSRFFLTRLPISTELPPVIFLIDNPIASLPLYRALFSTFLKLSTTTAISLSLNDAYSGLDIDSIKLYVDNGLLAFKYEAGVLTFTADTPLSDGTRIAKIEAKDFVGNQLSRAWGFTIDSDLPFGSIKINGGEESTSYARVRLNLEASDATTQVLDMIISNDGVFDTESWENLQSVLTDWILDEPQKTGLKTVYCMFRDEAGNKSEIYKDEIMLLSSAIDTIITSGPYSPTKETKAEFSYQASLQDALFSYKLDADEWSGWSQDKSISFSDVALGNHIFSVKSAKDLNGDQIISEEEEDPLPAQWTWTIQTEAELKKGERILYWRTE